MTIFNAFFEYLSLAALATIIDFKYVKLLLWPPPTSSVDFIQRRVNHQFGVQLGKIGDFLSSLSLNRLYYKSGV